MRGDAQRAEGRATVSGNLSSERFAPVIGISFYMGTGDISEPVLLLRGFAFAELGGRYSLGELELPDKIIIR